MYSLAFGIGTRNTAGKWLEVFYPAPLLAPPENLVSVVTTILGYKGGNVCIDLTAEHIKRLATGIEDKGQKRILDMLARSVKPVVATLLESDEALSSTPEAYLKLHLLSHRLKRPNEQNLDGIYACLPNVAWTDAGAIDVEDLADAQLKARVEGRVLEVMAIDKFPRMTNYVTPSGVRIAHAARVRLGAYVGEGTTVMHEGLINFNAGSVGPNMIEGRVSQGVMLDSGTDLGGGGATMGTLSGGGKIVVSVGKDCLIGSNSGCGISLGDRCTIEAGLYITAGTIVQVMDENRNFVRIAKARELSGNSDMLFIRNSQTGQVECRTNKKAIELNASLHAHN